VSRAYLAAQQGRVGGRRGAGQKAGRGRAAAPCRRRGRRRRAAPAPRARTAPRARGGTPGRRGSRCRWGSPRPARGGASGRHGRGKGCTAAREGGCWQGWFRPTDAPNLVPPRRPPRPPPHVKVVLDADGHAREGPARRARHVAAQNERADGVVATSRARRRGRARRGRCCEGRGGRGEWGRRRGASAGTRRERGARGARGASHGPAAPRRASPRVPPPAGNRVGSQSAHMTSPGARPSRFWPARGPWEGRRAAGGARAWWRERGRPQSANGLWRGARGRKHQAARRARGRAACTAHCSASFPPRPLRPQSGSES
jgi:hypothetical protein